MNLTEGKAIFVSFVHGFENKTERPYDEPKPALWEITNDNDQHYSFIFPQRSEDFAKLPYEVSGEMPLRASEFDEVHRFGFTGLQIARDQLFAGSWNGIYQINPMTKEVEKFITNRYTAYLHKFCVTDTEIIVAMPFKDMIAIFDHSGEIREAFYIDRALTIRQDSDPAIDWRFQSKPWSGSSGFYHFNNVQKFDNVIFLTSRNLASFVVVDLSTYKCTLRTMNHKTPVCVHDGDLYDGKFYFTSIDGKIFVVEERTNITEETVVNYDLNISRLVRLDKVPNNWCRGIAVTEDHIYVTIDGRYGTDLSFTLLQLDLEYEPTSRRKFSWSNVGDEEHIRYVTGFDIEVFEFMTSLK